MENQKKEIYRKYIFGILVAFIFVLVGFGFSRGSFDDLLSLRLPYGEVVVDYID
jgi:hypothetical protein